MAIDPSQLILGCCIVLQLELILLEYTKNE